MIRTIALATLLVISSLLTPCSPAIAADPDHPSRQWVFYLLPHSHVDIGYTHLQPEVERKQWQNIDAALELCRKTADYPPEARFKWNTEVLWAVDSYLRQAPVEKRQRLVEAIRAGQIELDGLYGNELTGLCRPEELLRLCEFGQRLGQRCGVKVDTAFISDVPGYTWGIVPAMAQAGIKYFSIGPNPGCRLGRLLVEWNDKPFYWAAPDGQHKVLCWIPSGGYALGHEGHKIAERLAERIADLEKKNYPYDISYMRWNVGGDNGAPDATLPDVVRDWNAKHASPKMVIATGSEMFHEFEKRYGDKLPSFRGDLTPYWEDGACSSARETALNRTAAERLLQAETLWAMLDPAWYPAEKFSAAWRNAILYDEHTWGAYNSCWAPDKQFVKEQWRMKQAFALDADTQSRELLISALAARGVGSFEDNHASAVDVFNTTSWSRTDLVVLPKEQTRVREDKNGGLIFGDVVKGPDGKTVPSQRLSTGELAFLVRDIPPLSGQRFTVVEGKAAAIGGARATETRRRSVPKINGMTPDITYVPPEQAVLRAPGLLLVVGKESGTIIELASDTAGDYLCQADSAVGLNRYCYVLGDKVRQPQQAGPAKVTVKESGPLVASLVIESDAPGCAKLTREIRVVDGLDRVDIVNTLDKKAVRQKEGVHFGFAFNVPDGQMRMDIPWAVIRPNDDQLPGSCKNSISVGRWVDVSNDRYGVTWATLDAPMVEVGGITADKMEEVTDPNVWIQKLPESQTLYSMVMNNHWFTNYKADQDGPTTFRYAILPHKQYDAMAAQRFGIERSQPLVVAAAKGPAPTGRSFLQLDTPDVLVASIKPSTDRRALIIRLFAFAGRAATCNVAWPAPPEGGTTNAPTRRAPKTVYLSNLAEDRLEPLAGPLSLRERAGVRAFGPISLPAWGLVTIRAELPAP